MSETEETSWEAQCANAAYEFALRCAVLAADNPYDEDAPLNGFIGHLMSELWDRNFSQTEIRNAFELAIRHMPSYAAGQERRSSTSTELFMGDWRAAPKS
jgi:hypothetical protein